ncbi:hypothetical protein N7G274_009273 [Stereocaulon virgatum]|uniref:Uncharacterized protein n=1 Tax=Stereocaulon virgatum TaxID=373712 RepID=A0ABR3ZXG3_9LECA
MLPGFGAQGPLVKPKSGDDERQSRGLFGLRRIPEEIRQVRNERAEKQHSGHEQSNRQQSHQRRAMAHRLSKVDERRYMEDRSFEDEKEHIKGIVYHYMSDSVHGEDHRQDRSYRGYNRDVQDQSNRDHEYESKGFGDDKTVFGECSVEEPSQYTSPSRPPVRGLLRGPSVGESHAGGATSRKNSKPVPSSRRESVSSRHTEYDAEQQRRSSRIPSSAQGRSRGLGSRH